MDNQRKKYFISSSLPYSNASPHLGNLIGSTLSGDIYARFKRSQGFEVIYLCGTDEYGSTTTIKAKQEGIGCQELCDKYNQLHKRVYDWFNIQFDVWGRTSTKEQTIITHEIFLGLYKNGFIEAKVITQLYCEKCCMFLPDRYVKGTCYHDQCRKKNSVANGDQCDICQKMIDVGKLIKPYCYLCKTSPISKESTHLFLKLDKLQNRIEKYIDNEINLKPNILAIVKSWLSMGLTSRCITRDLTWGTPVPRGIDEFLDQFSDKVFYVWFDAPFGYYSILANARSDWREWLNSPEIEWISMQAKDNVPFHTIFFPGSVLGTNPDGVPNFPLIKQICGTDYLLFGGQKFSKSNNVGLFGDEVIEISNKLGINEDYWRYYLAKIRPESHDSSFTLKNFVATIKADLINNIGNFVRRCVSLSGKYCGSMTFHTFKDTYIVEYITRYCKFMDEFKFKKALKVCLELSSSGNLFLQVQQPWEVAKNNTESAKNIIGKATLVCWVLLNLLSPFMPKTCSNILKFSLKTNTVFSFQLLENEIFSFGTDDTGSVPFKKIELEELEKLVG